MGNSKVERRLTMNKQKTQQHTQNAAQQQEPLQFARPNIVKQLDNDIKIGNVTNLIELLNNSREHLLAKTEDSSMIDSELNEYQEWFADLDTIRAVVDFLTDLNRFCPENLKPERRLASWQK